jgi:3-deoxy-D-manno-octulosonate 8-phosphate phosphatase (KDO 8-P phosphatase)
VQRAAQLGITLVHQGVASKLETYEQIVGDLAVDEAEVAYMGDDIVDLGVLERVGLSAAPADAVEDVRRRVHWVSGAPGGRGAVRELIETVLRAQGRWETLLASYTTDDRSRLAGRSNEP